jgi:hypothetical protein
MQEGHGQPPNNTDLHADTPLVGGISPLSSVRVSMPYGVARTSRPQ